MEPFKYILPLYNALPLFNIAEQWVKKVDVVHAKIQWLKNCYLLALSNCKSFIVDRIVIGLAEAAFARERLCAHRLSPIRKPGIWESAGTRHAQTCYFNRAQREAPLLRTRSPPFAIDPSSLVVPRNDARIFQFNKTCKFDA